MIPNVLKELFIPGTLAFFFAALTCGTCLLYRKQDDGRAGRRLISIVLALYWMWSTPLLAVPLLNLLTPAYLPVESRTQAAGANAIVVLGAGMSVFRSRGDMLEISTREDALRVMEGARVYRVLDRPWVIVTGGLGSTRQTEAAHMAAELESLGVPADRIVIEGRARTTHEHGFYVTTLLHERQTKGFVLVTSRQHIARALGVFRKAGWDPVPSSPEPYLDDSHTIEWLLPSMEMLKASEQLIYDKCAMLYYRLRGWV